MDSPAERTRRLLAVSGVLSVLQSVSDSVLGLFYEETDVARFVTDTESVGGGYTIPDPGTGLSDHSFFFDAPGVLDGSVAAVFFETAPAAGTALFTARLSGTPVHLIETTFENADVHSWHELSEPGILRSQGNELIFGVTEGKVTVSNVFVLYTSTQLTVKKPRQIVAAK
jgi:hypothetical protein